jgi:hypothetical protein
VARNWQRFVHCTFPRSAPFAPDRQPSRGCSSHPTAHASGKREPQWIAPQIRLTRWAPIIREAGALCSLPGLLTCAPSPFIGLGNVAFFRPPRRNEIAAAASHCDKTGRRITQGERGISIIRPSWRTRHNFCEASIRCACVKAEMIRSSGTGSNAFAYSASACLKHHCSRCERCSRMTMLWSASGELLLRRAP